MADIIITVSDPDTGMCTVFESLQLELDSSEEPKKLKSRPQHRDRANLQNSSNNLPKSHTGFPFDEDEELKPCSYYRQKYCCTGHHELPQDLNSWINYMTLKKSAGEKVVRKMASQQRQLAAEATDQKKNHILLHTQDTELNGKASMPPSKKIVKLKPLLLKTQTLVKT